MELWDLTDENGRVNGQTFIRDSGERIPEGMYHVVVEIWVTVSDGRVLLTQRHPRKFNGLKWECTCGSSLAGETPAVAAARELGEEVGINVPPESLAHLGRIVYNNYIVESFHLTLDQPREITMQAEEVVGARYVPIDRLSDYWGRMSENSRRHFKRYEKVLSDAAHHAVRH